MSTLTSSPEGANDRLPTAAHRLEAIPLELSDLAVSRTCVWWDFRLGVSTTHCWQSRVVRGYVILLALRVRLP